MTTLARPTTAQELLEMPDDGFRYELVKGELKRMAPAGKEHGRVTVSFTWRLARHVEANRVGVVYAAETGFRLRSDPDTVRAPDVAFVARDRAEAAGKSEGYVPGAPDLAVEVISPSDSYSEVESKAIEWLEAGSAAVVVLNPRRRTATLYRSSTEIAIVSDDAILNLDYVVPGFNIAVRDIFD